jgi:hypothetical protein
MNRFANAREAKEYLISRIVEEAKREGVALSDLERKELYFTESGWTLPDMKDVNDEFDRTHDQDEYEKKIAGLVKRIEKRMRKDGTADRDEWRDAIRLLSKEDHYILVIVRQAGASSNGST